MKRITANVSPMDAPVSPAHDLAIAVGILAASEQAEPDYDATYWGTLGLGGDLNVTSGVLAVAAATSTPIIAPRLPIAFPGQHVDPAPRHVYAVPDLRAAASLHPSAATTPTAEVIYCPSAPPYAASETVTVEIAAAARRVDPCRATQRATARDAAGYIRRDSEPDGVVVVEPTTSLVAALGGGGQMMRPGLLAFADGGTVILCDAMETAPPVVDAIRAAHAAGEVVVSRGSHATRTPARFHLVMIVAGPPPAAGDTTASTQRRYRRLEALLSTRGGVTPYVTDLTA
jgi:hypothetical protein